MARNKGLFVRKSGRSALQSFIRFQREIVPSEQTKPEGSKGPSGFVFVFSEVTADPSRSFRSMAVEEGFEPSREVLAPLPA